MNKNSTPVFILLIVTLFSAQITLAQWNYNTSINTPVIRNSGNQIAFRMSSDGKGGSFVTWRDYRAGLPDIYIQYLDATGNRLWDTAGVSICTNPADQSTPSIVGDMAGGAIVAFSDWRSGIERDIYAQRIDSSGVVQWTVDGVVVTNKPEREHDEKIITDGVGGAILVWEQQSATGQWDAWAQRINHAGVTMWANGGIPICTLNANRINPKIKKDGKGGAYLAWQDFRNGTDYNIYAQRISPSGALLWGSNGIEICNAPGNQDSPKIDKDSASGGIYLVWADFRNGIDFDLYAQRIDSTGTILWANNGVPVCTASGTQSAQDIMSTGLINGVIVAWKDLRSVNSDIYAQKLDPSGVPQWTTNGIPICNSINDQLNPNLGDDLAGGAIITWQDSSFVDWNIKSQHINTNGIPLWAVNGVDISTATGHQTSPKSVSDGNGGAIYAWQDYRYPSNISDIYAHHLFSDGTPNVGITQNFFNSSITTFPNPFTDNLTLTINLQTNEKFTINILNSMGQPVPAILSTTTVNTIGTHTITITTNKNDFPKGLYLIQLIGKAGVKTIKVVKT